MCGPRPILQRFGEVLRLDALLTRQVGDAAVRPLREGAGKLEHAVVRPCAQVHLLDRRAHQITET